MFARPGRASACVPVILKTHTRARVCVPVILKTHTRVVYKERKHDQSINQSINRQRRRRRRTGDHWDDGIAASIAIGSVRFGSVAFDRSIGRSTAVVTVTAATFGGARARWSGDLKRELNFGSVRDPTARSVDFGSIRSRSIDRSRRARKEGRKEG